MRANYCAPLLGIMLGTPTVPAVLDCSTSTCGGDWSSSFDGAGWSNCNDGCAMTGLRRESCDELHCLQGSPCCNLNADVTCEEPSIAVAFDGEGWVRCAGNQFMAGLHRSDGNSPSSSARDAMSDFSARRAHRSSKERMEEVDTGDGHVLANDGRKLRKPRLSNEAMVAEQRVSAETASPTVMDSPLLTCFVGCVVTMVAFQSEWPIKCGISGGGSPVRPEYAAPAFGFVAAMVLQQANAFVQSLLVID